MPVNLTSLRDGWLELESDPGLFTLLLKDIGVKGIQVEEIYDLQKSFEGPVYGFIFLFKWIEERRSRRKIIVNDEVFVQDEPVVNSMFFAHQIVPNSCATHSLLSVLLNCDKIYLGDTLTRLKEYTRHMSPENKGYAIGNTPELARAHNSHAKPEPRRIQEKLHGISSSRTVEAFHFVSYVQINNHLFELDGLKPFPIDHGPCGEDEDWTEKFRRVITGRLGIATGGEPYHDIRFNLMAVVPDRRIAIEHKLRTLKINRQIVLEALQQLVKVTTPRLSCLVEKPVAAAKSSTKTTGVGEGGAVTTSDVSKAVGAASAAAEISRGEYSATLANTDASSNCSTPTKTKGGTPTTTTTRSISSPLSRGGPPHPALDSHNYAKSPLIEGRRSTEDSDSRPRYEQYSGSDYDSDEVEEEGEETTSESEGGTSTGSRLPPPVAMHPGPGAPLGCSSAPSLASPVPLRPIHVDTKDFSRPLSIQTKFETSPTSCSSTDTSSEVGSAFNSPVRSMYFSSAQNSPNLASLKDLKRFVVIRVGGAKDTGSASEESPDAASATKREPNMAATSPPGEPIAADPAQSAGSHSTANTSGELGNEAAAVPASRRVCAVAETTLQPSPRQEVSSSTCDLTSSSAKTELVMGTTVATALVAAAAAGDSTAGGSTMWPVSHGSTQCKESPKYPQLIEPHQFAPKDLLALLKNIENEITSCESTLKDEMEKQKKYMIDDCRRTHNYDEFIGTFLAMLERNGLLNDLVERNMIVKRRQGINVGRLHKLKKVEPPAKRKTRTRRRK